MAIPIQIVEDRGYVWSAADAQRLHNKHRLLGAAAGCPADPARGGAAPACGRLPLVLGPDEVALAVGRGWADAYALLEGDAFEPPAALREDGDGGPGGSGSAPAAQVPHQQPKRRRDAALAPSDEDDEEEEDDDDDAYADYYASDGCGGGAAPTVPPPQQQQQQQQAPPQPPPPQRHPPWRAAVVDGARCAVPVTLEDAAKLGGAGGDDSSSGDPSTTAASAAAAAPSAPSWGRRALDLRCRRCWRYPRSPADAARRAAFAELHARGYALAAGGGLKYGGDLLAYAGDPDAAHAEFVVRAVAIAVAAGEEGAAEAAAAGGSGGGGAGGEAGGSDGSAWGKELAAAAAAAAAAARVAAGAGKTLLLAVVGVAPEPPRALDDGDAGGSNSCCGCEALSDAANAALPSPVRWAATCTPVFYAAPPAIGERLQPFDPPAAASLLR